MLSYASTYPGGLGDFFVNTAQDYSILTGLLAGSVVSTIISIAVSLKSGCPKRMSVFDGDLNQNGDVTISVGTKTPQNDVPVNLEIEWQKTMSIDNPLHPYKTLYEEELRAIDAWNKPLTTHHMERLFRPAMRTSGIIAGISFAVFLVIIPALALSVEVLTAAQLGTWISVCQHWCLVVTVFVVLVPPVQEGAQIWRQYRHNRDMEAMALELADKNTKF